MVDMEDMCCSHGTDNTLGSLEVHMIQTLAESAQVAQLAQAAHEAQAAQVVLLGRMSVTPCEP